MHIKSMVWFRQDLRLSDNPALLAAAKLGPFLAVYIWDNEPIGAANKLWLEQSLKALNASLGGNLNLYFGDSKTKILELVAKYQLENIFFNTSYEPWHLARAAAIRASLANYINIQEFNANYLWSVAELLKADGEHYKVFTAYKNKAYSIKPRSPLPRVRNFIALGVQKFPKFAVIEPWGEKLLAYVKAGESCAKEKLAIFLAEKLAAYKEARNHPALEHTSGLSTHLHFGEISPAEVWQAVRNSGGFYQHGLDAEHFLNELIWREFSAYLLVVFPKLPAANFNAKFDNFAWQANETHLKAWQKGQTGYPIIDAGMRELWQTGYMHNRLRMLVASFLVKNLNIHWHFGRDWFWDCLFDADLANNSASWQWVAGSGVDAAPYFRIFNPSTQAEKFDAEGDYIRKFLPELAKLPNKYLFEPWLAPQAVLQAAGVVLAKTYPRPLVELAASRQAALERYRAL